MRTATARQQSRSATRKKWLFAPWIGIGLLAGPVFPCNAGVVFERDSEYHHIAVVDSPGLRTLQFNDSQQTRMSLSNPLAGHFEYTEYFHTPWVWTRNIKRVLMIGLGGGSTQRSFQHYYPNTVIDTVELDPAVVEVARKYFYVTETPKHKIHTQDGRVFLQRAREPYDVILMDAYTTGRYGSAVPPHLTTKEFFQLARSRLSTNGVIAYNVIGTSRPGRSDIVGAMYRTMKEVFPQVYMFKVETSMNIVFVGTKSAVPFDYAAFQREGVAVMRAGLVELPGFTLRLRSFQNAPPPSAPSSRVLTDDFAPVESLMDKM